MTTETTPEQLLAHKNITQIIYGLYAASIIVGVTFFVAIVLNYIKRDDVRGTYLESHFRWQINTFWYALLFSVIGLVTMIFIVGFFVLGFAFIWFVYRIVKGWLRLNDGKPMYTV